MSQTVEKRFISNIQYCSHCYKM